MALPVAFIFALEPIIDSDGIIQIIKMKYCNMRRKDIHGGLLVALLYYISSEKEKLA